MNKIRKYFLVGVSAFVAEYCSFIILLNSVDSLVIAQTISFLLGLVVSFLGSRYFTFRSNGSRAYVWSKQRQLVSYVALASMNVILTNLFIYTLVHLLNGEPLYAKVIVMGSVVVWNYVIFNRLIFKTTK